MRGIGPFLRDAWRLARPYFVSEEKWSARLLLLAIVVLTLSLVAMTVVLNYWNRAFFNALQEKDWDSFVNLLFLYKRTASGGLLPGFTGIAVVYIFIAVYRAYLNQWLQIRWRRWMTTRFLDEWLADRAYYRISLTSTANGDGTDNPDQRIAEDLRDFIGDSIIGTRGILSLGLDLMSNVVTLVSFLSILWSLSGSITVLGLVIPGYMVWVALIYSAAGTWLTHLVGRPLAMLNFQKQKAEANFRFALVRLRENTEGVALSNGEAEEKRGLAKRFEVLAANWWGLMQRNKSLNALLSGYDQIAGIFPLVVAAPRYFSGALTLGDLTQTAGAFGRVQGAMSWVVGTYADLAVWRATVERLATFHRAIVAARLAAGHATANGPASAFREQRLPQPSLSPSGDDAAMDHYALADVTLALPDGQTLLHGADLSLQRGQSVVVSGRSGSGKSTLFRAFAGIWPFGGGQVQRPARGTSLFLPQRPYVPLGTLRHAVAYPADDTAYDDTTVRAALADAGLAHLADRLDSEENWSMLLSGGEQQRLALVRALLTKPDWLFLDEATASLDPEAETALYETLQTRLPRTTIISIAHRATVAAFHDRHIVFQRADANEAGQLSDIA